ncbi:MAG: hypothetical protein A3A43_01305 [Candidatus Liptonbacteria bacterium RIFCSPLOWO2_01_FULL_56_20]|uniref:Protein-L-isoaspartate O-methyltransferase n=1 Tax=Candidatus Liptonbacteria bacterium RIFCSPLOWO2_01_FULL_56_20 TaxID=1798652 RepID=A0A1G2CK92_9BACT|nr:MAG: hypothetical protein A2681_01460 [Candidatus Liptonbacteria bacterium RIFCSPHIGHO2_01_FULL_56_18b]OGZ01677.1 MAG: hypothetical protein A3A43_01305 [Candidatus Liptonbacteria bacterium RIFCSPLOWO2_01_FULL_56_20]
MANEKLIQELIREGTLKTPTVIEAFREINRKDFVLAEHAGEAHGNYPLPIGFGQTISQPLTVAFLLEHLAPQPGEKILEIGAGSGWLTALLSYIVAKGQLNKNEPGKKKTKFRGGVVAVERIPELCDMASRNIAKYSFIEKGVATVILGDGSKGYPSRAPFDRVIAAATASGRVPVAWKEQLRAGGRLVAPVEHSVQVIDKISAHDYDIREYAGFSFVPLVVREGGDR